MKDTKKTLKKATFPQSQARFCLSREGYRCSHSEVRDFSHKYTPSTTRVGLLLTLELQAEPTNNGCAQGEYDGKEPVRYVLSLLIKCRVSLGR